MQQDTQDIDQNELGLLAFDMAPVGIVLTEQRVIKTCNSTFAQMFGYHKAELQDQSFRMLYTNRLEFEKIRDIGIKPLQEKGSYTDERLVRHKDSSMFWCRFRAVTLNRDQPLARTILSFALLPESAPEISLTPRERQVVMHLSKGLTSKEIARILLISPRTVEDYRGRLRKKFGARNTTELLAHLVGVEP